MAKFISIVFFAVSILANAQDYSADLISDDLKKNADAVVRKDKGIFTVHNKGESTYSVEYAATIFNKDASGIAEVVISYNDHIKISDIEATVYDASGKKIRTIKNKDIADQSAGGSFMTSGRYKLIDMKYQSYPYTIEFSYTKESTLLLFYESWYPQGSSQFGVESSEFIAVVPSELGLRYKEINVKDNLSVTESNGYKTYHWKWNDLKTFDPEPYLRTSFEWRPVVLLGPTEFETEGYSGNMDSWEGLSTWYHELNKDRDALPEETKQEIMNIVSDIRDVKERVRLIYEYMQSKTRYVSVQLGIGGWQTLEASHVEEYGWGDCKALTNYTKSLLSVAGIESYEALVRAGTRQPIVDDFPSSQFNHVILSVPLESDTVWLECTSQKVPYNYLGDHAGNRKVLIVKESGGKLVDSQKFLADDNIVANTAEVILSESGDATAKVSSMYSGMEYETDGLYYFYDYSHDEQEKRLYQSLDIANFTINDFTIRRERTQPELQLDLELDIRNYATLTGKRIILPLNFMNNERAIPKVQKERKHPFFVASSTTTIDTVVFTLPKDYFAEFLPEKVIESSLFGEYSYNVEREEDRLYFIRKEIVYGGEYPAEMYEDYREYRKKIKDHDAIKSVFQKKT